MLQENDITATKTICYEYKPCLKTIKTILNFNEYDMNKYHNLNSNSGFNMSPIKSGNFG